MSRTVSCDRCGLSTDSSPDSAGNSFPGNWATITAEIGDCGESKLGDLCNRCIRKFNQWWEEGRNAEAAA